MLRGYPPPPHHHHRGLPCLLTHTHTHSFLFKQRVIWKLEEHTVSYTNMFLNSFWENGLIWFSKLSLIHPNEASVQWKCDRQGKQKYQFVSNCKHYLCVWLAVTSHRFYRFMSNLLWSSSCGTSAYINRLIYSLYPHTVNLLSKASSLFIKQTFH